MMMVVLLLFLILCVCLAMLNVWTGLILLAAVVVFPILALASLWVCLRIMDRF